MVPPRLFWIGSAFAGAVECAYVSIGAVRVAVFGTLCGTATSPRFLVAGRLRSTRRFHFIDESGHLNADRLKHLAAKRGDAIGPRRMGALPLCLTRQPPMLHHPLQHRVQRTGADIVAVRPQLLEHPMADDGFLARMKEDVNLPKREEDFSLQDGPIDIHYDYRKRLS
jgi:hypothetical protein